MFKLFVVVACAGKSLKDSIFLILKFNVYYQSNYFLIKMILVVAASSSPSGWHHDGHGQHYDVHDNDSAGSHVSYGGGKNGYSAGSGLRNIAQGSAQQAYNAVQNQLLASKQAAFTAKNTLAQAAAGVSPEFILILFQNINEICIISLTVMLNLSILIFSFFVHYYQPITLTRNVFRMPQRHKLPYKENNFFSKELNSKYEMPKLP